MDLAAFIAHARDRKDLSFRGLERESALDHGYLWHLEKGSKTAPSPDALEKLASALELSGRERDLLHLLAEQPIDDALYRLMVARLDIPWEDLRDVSRMSNRGARQTTEEGWLTLINRMREVF